MADADIGEEEEDPYEWVSIDEDINYLSLLLRLLAFSHAMISLVLLTVRNSFL